MTPWPYPRWIAHRGAGKLAPENTLAAFRVGASRGYRGFECDVKLSADGVPFLLHDSDLKRTTNGQGCAADIDWSALSQLDAGGWHSDAYAGEALASLVAIARFVRANGLALNIEIKPNPGDEAKTGRIVAEHVVRLWSPADVPPLLSSFHANALAAARQAAPELPRALLLDALPEGWLDQALELGCVAVVLDHRLIDHNTFAKIASCGLRALAYTVNEPADAERLLQLGIDGLITDAVDRFAPG